MKINRNRLLSDIIAFCQEKSGVIVGDPGVGKSFLLSEMVDFLLDKKIPAGLVRMDFLSEGTDKEIGEVLGAPDENWIERLKCISLPEGKRGIMIFDAYDAIKDEKLISVMLNQIAKAQRELSGWSIIVSVRTYDAAKSQRLIDLFPAEYNRESIHCRRFIIPILSDDELLSFLADNQKLKAIYVGGKEKLRDILKIPFFLSLLNVLVKSDTSTEALKALKSEFELLEMYWTKVVYKVSPSLPTELFLRNLAFKMVQERGLSVDKLDYLSSKSAEDVLLADQLLSENVLTEQGNTRRIAFSHNILFDYAVSRLVLKDTATELLEFIVEDQARPFFLRPSFIYLFARLWHFDSTRFWALYDELFQTQDDVVALFNKLIPSTIIAKEFDKTAQLAFLDRIEEFKIAQVTNVLQALRFQKDTANKAAQVSLLLKLSANLQLPFVWDFAVILEDLVNSYFVKSDTTLFSACGEAARNLMNFLLARRSEANFDQLASFRGTSMIIKTYSTGITDSKAILERVLEFLTEPDFNIAYFSTVTEEIEVLYSSDPEFAATIYERVFNHVEDSNQPESLLSGVLMTINFSRHDYFGISHTRLKTFFPRFVRGNPELAIPLGLAITNKFLMRKNRHGVLLPKSVNMPYDFSIDGVDAQYQVDMSQWWSGFDVSSEYFVHSQYIISYLEELIEGNELEHLRSGLKLYFANACSAFNWRLVLEMGARNAEILNELLFDLLLQPSILYCNDTIDAAGEFLESAAAFYSDAQVHQVEKVILKLPEYNSEEEIGKVNLVLSRLLSRIPKERLSEQTSLELISSSPVVPNEPLVTYGSNSEMFTTEMFLAEEGVDVTSPENDKLLAENRIMQSFNTQFINGIANTEAYDDPLQTAVRAFGLVKGDSTVPTQLAQTIFTSIAALCKIVLRSDLTLKPERLPLADQYTTMKSMILFCLDIHTEGDSFAEEYSSPSSGYSSTPRIEAADALPELFALTLDTTLLSLVERYSKDQNSVTRYGIIKSLHLFYLTQPELYWTIVNDRLNNETDGFVKSAVIQMLNGDKIFTLETDRFISAMQLAKEDISSLKVERSSFANSFMSICLSFLRRTGDTRINEILNECLRNNLAIGSDLVFQAFKIIQPENPYRNYGDSTDVANIQRVLDQILALLEICEEVLIAVQPDEEATPEANHSLTVIDNVIKRIYFSMQVNESLTQNAIKISRKDQERFYFFTKPLLEKILQISRKLGDGYMQGHSAHYFIEIMGEALRFDPKFSLAATHEVTVMAAGTNYTFDNSAIKEVVKYTERLLADHKGMLAEQYSFSQIMGLLNMYVRSGRPEALELLWRLDEIFR